MVIWASSIEKIDIVSVEKTTLSSSDISGFEFAPPIIPGNYFELNVGRGAYSKHGIEYTADYVEMRYFASPDNSAPDAQQKQRRYPVIQSINPPYSSGEEIEDPVIEIATITRRVKYAGIWKVGAGFLIRDELGNVRYGGIAGPNNNVVVVLSSIQVLL